MHRVTRGIIDLLDVIVSEYDDVNNAKQHVGPVVDGKQYTDDGVGVDVP